MDDIRFDNLTRNLAAARSRRGFVGGLAAIVGALAVARGSDAKAACPSGQIYRRGVGCVCRSTGRPPVQGACPCRPGVTCPEPPDACSVVGCVDGTCVTERVPIGEPCRGEPGVCGDEEEGCVCLDDDRSCSANDQCCSGICDSYDDRCRALPLGCDPETAPCPDDGLCCPNGESLTGYRCLYDTLRNQKACGAAGATCEEIENCLNYSPARECVVGVCCLAEGGACGADIDCCSGLCDSYDNQCRTVQFGCDPVTDPCPDGGLCCPSGPGFTCRYDTLNNQKSCGTTCETIDNCLNYSPDRICVDGECVAP